MNRELRRLQAKEEERSKKRRAQDLAQRRARKRDRTGFFQFFGEVRQELKRVAWPNRKEVVTFTGVTLITSGFVTAVTFGLDFAFKEAVLWLVRLV